jgi:cytochrome c biogenesis protein CcmG/thiol:disulfide interchange protein DsbE
VFCSSCFVTKGAERVVREITGKGGRAITVQGDVAQRSDAQRLVAEAKTRPPRIGVSAPDFTVQDDERKVTLSKFRGQVVVLNFWATWCPPCVQETPSLIRMQQRFKDRGVVILAVSIDVDDAAYHRFLRDYHVDMLTVRDPDQKSPTLYGTHGWPETYIIDRNGVLRRKFVGPVDWNSPEVPSS